MKQVLYYTPEKRFIIKIGSQYIFLEDYITLTRYCFEVIDVANNKECKNVLKSQY